MPRSKKVKTDSSLTPFSREELQLPGYDPFAFDDGATFNPALALAAVQFFDECVTFTAGEWRGKPFKLVPWQRAIVANIFGWRRPNGTRRYREVFIYVPRKNGKTELAAGLGDLLTFADKEPGANVYCAAADREQARLVFSAARTMVENEPAMASRSKVYTNGISVPSTGSNLRVISAEAYSKHGMNAHGVIIDELHAHPNRELTDVLVTSTGARRQPLTVYITTADYMRESICNEKYGYACKVRDNGGDPGKPGFDSAFLPVIYEAVPSDDWRKPETWRKANPNLGTSISYEYMERECRRAQETPAYENTFKRLHLNMQTEQAERCMPMHDWDGCDGAVIESQLVGRECWGGLDLASNDDIVALVWLFRPEADGDPWIILPRFWVPRDNAEMRERRDRVPYLTWERQGYLTLTDGVKTDYAQIEAQILRDTATFNVVDVAADKWNLEYLRQRIDPDSRWIIEYQQSLQAMSQPTKQLLGMTKARQFAHGGNPVLRWMASNLAVFRDGNDNIRPSKKHSGEKIDGMVALIMAIGRSMIAEPASAYETRGILRL